MSLTSGVLAPAIAMSLLTAPSSLDGSAAGSSLLSANLIANEKISLPQPLIRTVAGHWTWNGIALRSSDFKVAYDTQEPTSLVWFSGKVPDVSDLTWRMSVEFEPHQLAPVQARSVFAEHLRMGSWDVPHPTPIIHLGQQPEAWWRLRLPESGRIFWLRESDGTWGEEHPMEMFASAVALVHRENPVASASTGLEEIPLSDLLDVSYLRNRVFRILNCLDKEPSFKTCGNYARSNVGRYTYPLESFEHSEMVGYYSIQRAVDWHRGIQSEEQKKSFFDFGLAGPIDVFVRAVKAGAPSYQPRSGQLDTANPIIFVPLTQPDFGLGLTNLSVDSDVYLHEFAHHVLYRAVVPESSYSQARVIQEGLADYFTYSITGNNKLAESSQSSGALREGNKTDNLSQEIFNIGGDTFDFYAVGEILSSVFWKLRSQLGEWKNGYSRIDKILWDSIDLLPAQATLYQLACAVVKQTDIFEKNENLTSGSVKTPILAELAARQFFENTTINPATGCPNVSAILKAVDDRDNLKSELPPPTNRPTVVFDGSGRRALPPFGGSLYQPLQPRRVGCGQLAVPGQHSHSQSSAYLIAIIFLPLLTLLVRVGCFFQAKRSASSN